MLLIGSFQNYNSSIISSTTTDSVVLATQGHGENKIEDPTVLHWTNSKQYCAQNAYFSLLFSLGVPGEAQGSYQKLTWTKIKNRKFYNKKQFFWSPTSDFELSLRLSNFRDLKLSLCMSKAEYLNWYRKTVWDHLNDWKVSNIENLTSKIFKSSLLIKIKTSSPPTPYYSTEHLPR